jgi:hypothetical protein
VRVLAAHWDRELMTPAPRPDRMQSLIGTLQENTMNRWPTDAANVPSEGWAGALRRAVLRWLDDRADRRLRDVADHADLKYRADAQAAAERCWSRPIGAGPC